MPLIIVFCHVPTKYEPKVCNKYIDVINSNFLSRSYQVWTKIMFQLSSIILSRTLNVRMPSVASLGLRHFIVVSIKWNQTPFRVFYTLRHNILWLIALVTIFVNTLWMNSVNLLIHYRYLLALEFYKQVHFHRVESNSNRAMSHQVET